MPSFTPSSFTPSKDSQRRKREVERVQNFSYASVEDELQTSETLQVDIANSTLYKLNTEDILNMVLPRTDVVREILLDNICAMRGALMNKVSYADLLRSHPRLVQECVAYEQRQRDAAVDIRMKPIQLAQKASELGLSFPVFLVVHSKSGDYITNPEVITHAKIRKVNKTFAYVSLDDPTRFNEVFYSYKDNLKFNYHKTGNYQLWCKAPQPLATKAINFNRNVYYTKMRMPVYACGIHLDKKVLDYAEPLQALLPDLPVSLILGFLLGAPHSYY